MQFFPQHYYDGMAYTRWGLGLFSALSAFYIYKRIKFHANTKPRKLTGLFVDEFAPLKTRDYSSEKAVI